MTMTATSANPYLTLGTSSVSTFSWISNDQIWWINEFQILEPQNEEINAEKTIAEKIIAIKNATATNAVSKRSLKISAIPVQRSEQLSYNLGQNLLRNKIPLFPVILAKMETFSQWIDRGRPSFLRATRGEPKRKIMQIKDGAHYCYCAHFLRIPR